MGESDMPTSNREKLLKNICEWSNIELADIAAERFGCIEEIDGTHPKCYGFCRDCIVRWLNETEERDG